MFIDIYEVQKKKKIMVSCNTAGFMMNVVLVVNEIFLKYFHSELFISNEFEF